MLSCNMHQQQVSSHTVRGIKTGSMEGRTYIVGREGHIYLGDSSISRHHAEIKFIDGKIRLRDLGSTNGIYLVRNNRALRIQQDYVEMHQPIVIGRHHCTVQSLLKALIDVEEYRD